MSLHVVRCVRLSVLTGLLAMPALAVAPNQPEVNVCVDVPSTLVSQSASSFTLQAYQMARAENSGNYKLAFSSGGLSGAAHIDAMYLMTSGGCTTPTCNPPQPSFIFSMDAPASLVNQSGSSVSYQPYDILRYYPTGGSGGGYYYKQYLSGSSIGMSGSGNIDAVSLDKSGNLLISIDAPTTLTGGLSAKAADVVKVSVDGSGNGTVLGFLFQASACSTCSFVTRTDSINLNGVELADNGDIYVNFNVPVSGSSNSFPAGSVVMFDADAVSNALSSAWKDTSFPRGSVVTDFSFRVSPGVVPDGYAAPGTPLTAVKQDADGNSIKLTFGDSSTKTIDAEAMDYSVYEGLIGTFGSYESNVCTTSFKIADVPITPKNVGQSVFWIVVPHNNDFEGSYGKNSAGVERTAAATPCSTGYSTPTPMKQMVRSDSP